MFPVSAPFGKDRPAAYEWRRASSAVTKPRCPLRRSSSGTGKHTSWSGPCTASGARHAGPQVFISVRLAFVRHPALDPSVIRETSPSADHAMPQARSPASPQWITRERRSPVWSELPARLV